MSVSQRVAVFEATLNALKSHGVDFVPGTVDVKSLATPKIRKSVIDNLCEQFVEGKVSLKDTPTNRAKLCDEDKLKDYVSSLVSNYWKRDGLLNGSGGL